MKFGSKNNGAQLDERYSHIRSLITDDRVADAIKELQTLVDGRDVPFANELIGLQARLRRVIRDDNAGSLTPSEANAEKNRINQSVLQLIDQIEVHPLKHLALRELTPAEKKRRANYLQDLKEDVENRLKVSIHRAILIDLGIDDTPSATYLPWIYTDVNSKHDFKDYHEAFEEYGRRMLLLGSPGSGKTITHLYIAQHLIREAENDDNAPIPLLVNLSKFQPSVPQSRLLGWVSQRRAETGASDKRIERWLAKEFTVNPDISDEIAKTWIKEGRIAALMDGLDEVNDEHRAELVQILNETFLKDHPDSVVVVCSRINEYRPLQDREETTLRLKGAVTLQPLTKSKIEEYLKLAKATGLREALLTDETLYQMAQTPLTLTMMTLAYGGSGPSSLPSNLSFTERRHHMMDAYVAKMLQREERRKRQRQFDNNPAREVPTRAYAYKPATINRLLGWLAVRMSVRMQTAISLSKLHSFLTRDIDRDRQAGIWWITSLSRASVVFAAALIAGLAVAPMTKRGLLLSLSISLLGAVLFMPIARVARSVNDDYFDDIVGIKKLTQVVLLVSTVIVATVVTLGVALSSLSSVLPFNVPPIPAALIVICVNIAFVSLLVEFSRTSWYFAAATLIVFFIGLVLMFTTRSAYGWYIPALSLLTFQVITAFIKGWRDDGLKEARTVLLIILAILFFSGLSIFLMAGFQWHVAFISYTLVIITIMTLVQRALLPLVGLLLFFVSGAVLGGYTGAVFGGLLYGYLVLLGFLLIDTYETTYEFPTRLKELVDRCFDYFNEIADRYLFTPVLLRILAMSRCLPLRSRKFFNYTEQALLLKRSASDIEFMHRLLRDYFALRDLQPLLTSADSNRRLQAIRNLGFQGDAAIDALAEFVRNADPDVRHAAASALGRVVAPATVPHIEVALRDAIPKVRRAAVFSMKNLTYDEQTRLVPIVMNDPDTSVQRAVIELALGSLWHGEFQEEILWNAQNMPDIRQFLFDLVGDNRTQKDVRSNAIDFVGQLFDPNSIPYLIKALNDRAFGYRTQAALLLSYFDDQRALQALQKAASERNKQMRLSAAEALDRMRSRGVMQVER